MKITKSLRAMLGMGAERDLRPPRNRAISPGLQVTDTDVWAWYELGHTNSDLKSEEDLDAEQDAAEAALRFLAGHEVHVRVLWGRIDGDSYLSELDLGEGRDSARRWAGVRAEDIDARELPERTVLLGVRIADRAGEARDSATRALGIDSGYLPAEQIARYTQRARQLAGPLHNTVWRVRLASAEVIAWSLTREFHRETAAPLEGAVTGASLARLTSGRVEFSPDHYRVMGADGRVAAYGAVLALTDFPEVMATPGQEWLAGLGDIETSALDALDDNAGELVLPEASLRFVVPDSRTARKTVSEARRLAKEQRQSAAKTSAGEPEDAILAAEAELRDIEMALSRRHTMLVHDHPRVIVTAPDRTQLDAKITAVVSAYDDMGITAGVLVDEQREGWLETLPGDRVRISDLGHWRDATALSQSWFWRGSKVGSNDPRVPVIGYTTGSTTRLVRYSATESVSNSDAPVTIFTGRTRRGKTTAMQLSLLDACLAPANVAAASPGDSTSTWAVMADFKGDADGVVGAAHDFGLDADLIRVGPDFAGALCGFQTSDPEHAVENVVGTLALCLPRVLAERATSILQRAAFRVSQHPDPATWKVVEEISRTGRVSRDDALIHEVGETLQATTSTGFGRLVAGRPIEGTPMGLPTRAGLTVLQFPGIASSLPEAGTPEDRWTPSQRLAVAALRGVLGWCSTIAGSIELRRRPKVIAFPEVHLLTATADGRAYLTQVARMGAAFGTSLLLDTQDAGGIESLVGLAEGISDVFCFAQQTEAEQNAAARMLGLAEGPQVRRIIGTLDKTVDVQDGAVEVRHGHCLYRDRSGSVASVQWTVPSPELLAQLNTSAAATADRYEAEAEARRAQEVHS